jgi:tetratricopeptide (TPR) repeat protein
MARCEILFAKEAVLERLGRRTEQMANIAALLAAARSLDDPVRFAQALLREASAAAYAGDTDRAIRAATQALETFRGAHDAPGEAEALRELGFVHWRAGDFPGALARVREALTLHRQLGDVGGEATALHNLAEIHRSLGSPQRALEWYGQAIELHWAAGNRNGEILTAFGMANALLQAGNEVLACEKYAHALALSERYGERTMQSRALHALAMRGKSAGDLDEAMRCMQRAVEVDRAINYAHALGHDLVDLGLLHALRNERSQARAALEEAAVWFDLTGDEAGVGAPRAHLADLESGRVPQAHERGDHGVKSHLPLSEGKVYCEFESPFSRASQRTG